MQWINDKIIWSARIAKNDLTKAYRNDALGIHDTALLDELGTALYLRCSDILYINDAQQNRWRCPRCEFINPPGAAMVLEGERQKDGRDNRYRCRACGLIMTWGQFTHSYRRMQLNPGGAVGEFTHFVHQWPLCKEDGAKFLCIDRLVHAFHYSMKARPDLPTRSAAVNLVQGKLYDIMIFLNELSEGRDDPQTQKFRQESIRWKQEWRGWWEGMEQNRKDKQNK
jgi:DNA-directed RNA polymerase subunit RPC12/RpoP